MTVYANGLEIVCKKQSNKIIASFPDVCFTPPENPATPPGVPVPYPSFGFDNKTDKGTGTVKIGGETVSQKNKSYYEDTKGTEAGSAAKKGIISSNNTGKAYAIAWSGSVKFEKNPVSRFVDMATNNHSSPMGNVAPNGFISNGAFVNPAKPETKCPCCGAQPAHANQVDGNGDMLQQIKEDDFYNNIVKNRQAKIDSIPNDIATGKPYTLDPVKLQKVRDGSDKQLKDAQDAKATIDNARAQTPPCPNLHDPPDTGCGVHFNMPHSLDSMVPPSVVGKSKRKSFYRENILGFKDSVRQVSIASHTKPDGSPIPAKNETVNHKTPLQAGGCPTSQSNLVPNSALTPGCQQVNEAQTKLHDFGETDW